MSVRRVTGLDVLRCAAIGGVVFAHGFHFLYPHVPPLDLGIFSFKLGYLGHGGFYGVELFFVLSGFLIGGILIKAGEDLKRTSGLLHFYSRRWFRTLPLYWLMLAVNLAVILWVLPHPNPLSSFSDYLWFGQSLASIDLYFFAESWSLVVEEWFYFLFPLGVAVLLRLGVPSTRVFLVAGIAFYVYSTLYRYAIAGDPGSIWSEVTRRIALARFDAMMVGVFAAWLSVEKPKWFRAHPWIVAGLGMLILLAAYVSLYLKGLEEDRLFVRTLRFNAVSLGFGCLLPLASSIRTLGTKWLDVPIEWVARWSYAIYLTHMLFFSLSLSLWFPDYQTNAADGWFGFLAVVLGSTAVSALLYYFYELPCTRSRDRFAFSREHRPSD